MARKYWQLKLKGKRSTDRIEAIVGPSGGNLVRIHYERGETHVYFTEAIPAPEDAMKSLKKAGKLAEVSIRDVKKLG
jgi:hypothetical protein